MLPSKLIVTILFVPPRGGLLLGGVIIKGGDYTIM